MYTEYLHKYVTFIMRKLQHILGLNFRIFLAPVNKGKIKYTQKTCNFEKLVIYILPQFLCRPIQQIQYTHHVQLVAEIQHKNKHYTLA